MIATQYINLNMVPSGYPPVLYLSQYDVGRPCGFVVHASGSEVNLDTYTVTLEATRTDGVAITVPVTTSGNIAAFATTATMTNKADKYPANMVIVDGSGNRIASIPITVLVVKVAMDENAESIEEDASLYQQYTGTVQTLIAAIREDVADLKNHISGIATPEMYGAKGDGVTDDSAAFRALAAAQNVSIVIPDRTYVINDSVTIAGDVISDRGTYPNYVPEYAKHLKLNLNSLAYGDNIFLPVETSYAESITYINGKYYVLCREYSTTPERGYIAVYDLDMTYQSMVYTDAAYGIGNNSCTDGTFLYVDFDNGYHCKYDPADLSTAVYARQDASIRNIEYYNHQLYAIAISANSVSVSRIDDTFTTLTDTWTVITERQTLQSATIYNGQLYIPTTIGMFKLIDLVSHEVLEVKYEWLKEVEKFFTAPDGSLAVMGHLYGFNGIFNIGALNGGVDADIVNYIPLDGSRGDVSVTNRYRANVYNVRNGIQAGFPIDDCDVMIFDHVMIAVDRNDNSIYSYGGGRWSYIGTIATANILIGTGLYISYDAGGGFSIFTNGYRLTSASKTINYDFSQIYSRCGLADDRTFTAFTLGRKYGLGFSGGGDIFGIQLTVTKTSIQLECRNITTPSGEIDCYTVFRLKVI